MGRAKKNEEQPSDLSNSESEGDSSMELSDTSEDEESVVPLKELKRVCKMSLLL